MNWKKPNKKIFWVPVPYLGQNLYNLTKWKRKPDEPKQTIQLTNPDNNETELFEILDYLGYYKIENIPDYLARDCTDNVNITGRILAAKLVKKMPEFKTVQEILFYQLSTI